MEKGFALGISGMFATLTAGVFGMPVLFAQAPADIGILGLAERLGLGFAIAVLGYLLIVKIIDVFERALLAKLNTHDAEVQGRLSGIEKQINRIDEHLSSASQNK